MADYLHVETVAPGIHKTRLGVNQGTWLVERHGRVWTTREISDRLGLERSKVSLRIREAVRDGRPVAWIFRPKHLRTSPTNRKKAPEGMLWVDRPSCRHPLAPEWRLALCRSWGGQGAR